MSTGTWFDLRRGEITLTEYMTGWLEARQRTGQHGARYATEAARLARDYVLPQLGQRFLVDLSIPAVRRWHADLIAGPIEAGRADSEEPVRRAFSRC